MWKSAYVGVYQLLNWKMHGETLKFGQIQICKTIFPPQIFLLYLRHGQELYFGFIINVTRKMCLKVFIRSESLFFEITTTLSSYARRLLTHWVQLLCCNHTSLSVILTFRKELVIPSHCWKVQVKKMGSKFHSFPNTNLCCAVKLTFD